MFPGYPSTSGGGQRRDEPPPYNGRGNGRQFNSYGRSAEQERIMEARKQKEERKRQERRLQKAKEQRTYRAYKLEDSDESSDDAPSVPVEFEAFSEHLNGIVSKRREIGKKSKRHDSDDSAEDRKPRKRKNADKEKKYKKDQSSSSDSGESRKQSRRSRRARSPSSDSEQEQKPVVTSKPKYYYMKDSNDIRQNLFQDFQSDADNFSYERVYAKHLSSFFTKLNLLKTPGQPSWADKVFGTSQDIKKVTEEKTERSSLSERPIKFNEKKREYVFRKIDFPVSCNYMPLSNDRFEEFRYLHEIESERQQRYDEYEKTSRPQLARQEIQEKLNQVKKDINMNPRSAELYHKFLDLEDRLFKSIVESGDTTDAQGRKSYNERKLDIIQKAIVNCPGDVDLKVKKINLLVEDGLAADVIKEWNMLLTIFPHRCNLWERYLDHIQNSASHYSAKRLEQAFSLCDEKLTGVFTGIVRSHKAESGTDDFLFNCFTRRLNWLLSCGFTERAIACVQATLDLTCGSHYDKTNRREFENFWKSNMARFGDIGSRGFIDYRGLSELDKIEQIRNERIESEKFKDQKEAVQYRCQKTIEKFTDYEREMSELYVRPGRTFFDEEVEFTQVDHCELFMCDLGTPIFKRVAALFSLFGATIYQSDSLGLSEPGFHLALELGVEPPYQDFPVACLERVLMMMKNCYSIWGSDAAVFIYSIIPTKARILAAKEGMSNEEKFKEMSNLHSFADCADFFDVESRKLLFGYFTLVEMFKFACSQSLKNKWLKKANQFLKLSLEQILSAPGGQYNVLILQMYFALLVKVAENQDDENIGDCITRWILELNQVEKVSPNQLLSAKTKLRSMCTANLSEASDLCQFSSSLLEHHTIYCKVLVMYLEYCARSPGSCNWIESIQHEFIETNSKNCYINLAFLDLLLKQRNKGNSHRHDVIEHAIQCVKMFPKNKLVWKKFCEVGLACQYLSTDRLRLANLENDFGAFTKDMYCLSKMKWELSSGRNNDRACKLAVERAESTSDPFWWRMAMKYGTPSAQQVLYVRAANNCRWSKQLHLDMFQSMQQAIEMQILETGIRMVTSTDEYETLRLVGANEAVDAHHVQ